MTKFNVGDEVRIKSNQGSDFNIGDVGVIKTNDNSGYRSYEVEVNGEREWFDSTELELVEKKITKNQRITVLENEVAELKLIVHELRNGRKTMRDVMNEVLSEPSTTNTVEDIIEFEGQQYRKVNRVAREGDVVICHSKTTTFIEKGKPHKVSCVDGHLLLNRGTPDVVSLYFSERTPETVAVYELIEGGMNPQIPIVDETIEPLTPNQQRAEIIEKAKAFVDENGGDDYHFEVDENERTVFAWKLVRNGQGYKAQHGIATCNPSDVYNEYLGRAISFGRAECLDVSEFEQAVQPESAPEQIAMYGDKKVTFKDDDHGHCDSDYGTVHYKSTAAKNSKIINDTNAIYGGVE